MLSKELTFILCFCFAITATGVVLLLYYYFAITAAGVVLVLWRPLKSPRTSSVVQTLFYFWSFENSGKRRKRRNLKQICLESYNKQHFAF